MKGTVAHNVEKRINIFAWLNGGGLSRDVDVLRAALAQLGFTVFLNRELDGVERRVSVSGILTRLHASRLGKAMTARDWLRRPFDLNVHIEDIRPGHLWMAKRNVLIPNQEWFRDWCRPHLPAIDAVWAKSRLAGRLFAELGCTTRFVGWSGADRKAPGASGRKALTALHISGASREKGTEAVLDVWSRNPDWPMLRVLRRTRAYRGDLISWRERVPAANIEIITERVDEPTLVRMQNESALCLCPSEAEGFGHVIAEGMSVGAVVITTDAPPMNELVTRGTGLLVAVERSRPMGLGERYVVSLDDLEEKIRLALAMTDAEREAMGQAARAQFEAMNEGFRERLAASLAAIFAEADGRTDPASPSEFR